MPRFHCPVDLATGLELELPAGAARHVQVLRLQPGDAITLFQGGSFHGGLAGTGAGEFEASVTHMGRSSVRVQVGAHHAIEREAPREVHLLAGITANERMDWLVEKATELGVASITQLLAERSVPAQRGARRQETRALAGYRHRRLRAVRAQPVPVVAAAVDLAGWLEANAKAAPMQRLLLSLHSASVPIGNFQGAAAPAVFLSGPEGGLSPAEEDAALAQGFLPVSLGRRVLRAETAALAALARMAQDA
ncbi:MAG: 16S rRNA (uracil(1498)-N(3))-methyltransferase [Simplicispira sp.]|nr:16S rRNA (uracil(1498)-N(3))-methyltransferase [Simplicispira sp.]